MSEIPDYKKQYILKFKKELIASIKQKNTSKEKIAKDIEEVEKLLTDKVYLMGKWFYDLSIHHKVDFEILCRQVFASSKATKMALVANSENLLKALLNPFLHSQADFYIAADINKTRFSRLLKLNKLSELYADEIYGIAIALDIKPLVMFKYFCNDGERPAIALSPKGLEKDAGNKTQPKA